MAGSARECGLATRAVAQALGIELVELADWNCCGAVSAGALSMDAIDVLCRRNLKQVPDEAPALFCPCPHCYTNFARALVRTARDNGHSLRVSLHSILDVFASDEALSSLVDRREEPLTGLKMAGYYGCKLSRPDPEVAELRAAGPPVPVGARTGGGSPPAGIGPLERMIEACGATPVAWSAESDCCGAALGLARGEVAEELLGRIFQAALEAEAEALVVACPLCHLNLDLRQHQVSQRLQRSVDIPVFFVTELMAVALGLEESECWLDRHLTSPLPMFMSFFKAEEEREYWGEEGPPQPEAPCGRTEDSGPFSATRAQEEETEAAPE